jgi:hypothetical protein
MALMKNEPAESFIGDIISVEGEDFTVDEQMATSAQFYVDVIHGILEENPEAQLSVEKKFSLAHVHPDARGTNDACILTADTLHVLDYKNGYKYVDVVDNKQLKYYAIGALSEIGYLVQKVVLHIIQPNLSDPKDFHRFWETTPEHILSFEAELKDSIAATEVTDPEAQAGAHCDFCPAKNICDTYATNLFQDAFGELAVPSEFVSGKPVVLPNPKDMTDAEFSALYRSKNALRDWMDLVEEEVSARLYSGRAVEGVKLVRTSGRRYIKDAEGLAQELLKQGFTSEEIMTQKIKPIGQLEKLLGKKDSSTIQPYLDKHEGKLAIVPESDKRLAVETFTLESIVNELSNLQPHN